MVFLEHLEHSDLPAVTPHLTLVGGASGIGKTTIIDALLSRHGDVYARPVSYTSRARRRGEGDKEYLFVSRDKIVDMFRKGEVPSVDEVYGNLYAMSQKSIDDLLEAGVTPIKEVHPLNHFKIQEKVPNSISVLIVAPDEVPSVGACEYSRRERIVQDSEYYSATNPLASDIVLRVDRSSPDAAASNLHVSLTAFMRTSRYFPRPKVVDEVNTEGYTKASPEYSDEYRMTTRNFHDLSYQYFLDAIEKHISRSNRCLEIGTGQGWLTNLLPLADIDYTGIDISASMVALGMTNNNRVSSARYINYPDQYFDVAVASLADPYLYPAALCEIRRVLQIGGKFIFTSPSRCWSDGLRADPNRNKTGFKMSDGSLAEVFSFTFLIEELSKLMSICGFSVHYSQTIHGKNIVGEKISPAISEAAKNLGMTVFELPILNFVVARREQ